MLLDVPLQPSAAHAGMGAIVHDSGVAFRVWAPHAESVAVSGSFNDWDPQRHPLASEGNGYWYGDIPEARPGDEYRFHLRNGDWEAQRVDPYARQVTNSIGNGVITAPDSFDWGDDHFTLPPRNEIAIYELHIGTFGAGDDDGVRTFDDAIARLDHIAALGVNAVELMPVHEFAGDRSWGYNPSHLFAVESAYGGPDGLRRFVREAHRRSIGVILDVVYNHAGPSDLDLWQFDGWSENGGGGIYFYNDWRAETPWGSTRPDYGRAEVRRFLRDNAMMWLEEYRVDGLRMDGTFYIRTVRGETDPQTELPDGWSLFQEINGELRQRFPNALLIAEDLQDNEWLTKPVSDGGAGFDVQWCARFVHPVRAVISAPDDAARSMATLRAAISTTFNGDPFERVIYSESHDEVANGKTRVPQEINPENPTDWFAQKRSTLAAAIVFTTPGVPMLFQGQESLLGGWFEDTVPLDWEHAETFPGIIRLYRDLIRLRRNLDGKTRGLLGSPIEELYFDEARNLLFLRRHYNGGPGDDVLVLLNLADQWATDVEFHPPADGLWRLRFNSDWAGYSPDFGSEATDLTAENGRATVSIPPYTALLYSQDPS